VRRERGVDNVYKDQYLSTAFQSGSFSQSFWAAITYGKHTSLVPIRKRTAEERTNAKDKLGMNTDQYTHEILEPHFIPFIKSLPGDPSEYFIVEVNKSQSAYRKETECCSRCARHTAHTLEWPPSSPELNPIENLWAICKNKVWKKMEDPSTRVRTQEEYIALCQRE
jgi:hypothetical protein